MIIAHKIPAGLPGGHLAYLAARVLDGLAVGYMPLATLSPLPPLYQSGIRFALSPSHGTGIEDFGNPWTTLARGNCNDLVLYRLVELLLAGQRVHTRAEWLGNAVHVVIRHSNGQEEDPSALLGAPDPHRSHRR